MPRSRHPHKEIEAAIAEAEGKGWTVRELGHWGRLFCPHADRDGCQVGVNGTPKNAGNHAKQIRQAVNRCPHAERKEEDDHGDI
jgi:hypothetical protein